MAREDGSFSDNMSAVARIYGTHADLDTDENGHVAHVDVENKGKGEPVDVAALEDVPSNRGTERTAKEQAATKAPAKKAAAKKAAKK